MFARDHVASRSLPIFALALIAWLAPATATRGGETVSIGDLIFVNQALVGVGRLPADLRDKLGETFGSGSAIAVDPKSWVRTPSGYQGTFYMLPDRGFNVTGTSDYRARINKLFITFKPLDDPAAVPVAERQNSVAATLTDTILLTDAAGQSLTGLDPVGIRRAANGFPDLPQASNGRVSIDSESLALLPDGGFFIGDEYGPYVYRFSPAGRLLAAIRPPEAFLPKRKGEDHFASNNPGPGAQAPHPPDPETGRANNQGFEGLTLTPPGGKFLVVALQSATRQDGGTSPETRRYSRLLYYDVADRERPRLVREYVVPMPLFESADGQRRVAAQSELLALDETFFLLLCRDSGNGYGTSGATSRYRSIDLLDTSRATNIAGSRYDGTMPVAPNGKLVSGVVPATLTRYIDINATAELQKFGLHNGEPNDRNNLSEKWEGMALAPALDPAHPNDYFLFVTNDNDFITQNGYQAGAPYKDASGLEVDTMILVYRITLPQQLK
ncbi:MAG: esterase-like activity of phytase family protein [Hyphomicrobiales bacterium]|nr:esterase-like activity of phytase family protein [Hyphomicrobiales bacterium]